MCSRMNALGTLQPGKRFYRFPRLLLRHAQIVKTLQVKPEFRTRTEEVRQTQGCVASDGALPVQNACDAVGRNMQVSRQLVGAHGKLVQFFRQMLPRMYRGDSHAILLSDNRQSLPVTAPMPGPAIQSRCASDR